MSETWKDVVGYEGLYQVSDLGHVKSLNYNHTMKPKVLCEKRHSSGYLTVVLCKDGQKRNHSIHILVAGAFIENPERLPCVNHIDGNKANNKVENLEWVTRSQNTRHAIRTGLRADSYMRGRTGISNPLSKAVAQYSKDGELLRVWPCVSEAARHLGCNPCTITNCTKGRIKSCKGYIWKSAG